jgi:endonuclease G
LATSFTFNLEEAKIITRSATIEFEFLGGEPQVLVLTQFSASSTNDPYDEGHATAWAELPEKKTDENFIYVSHFASLNNRTVRNYSFCYDKTLHVAHWVAYPLHSVYRGSIDRTDDFQYDPKVDYSWQPNLAAGSYRGSYDRGHQLPSADRTATRELNLQTFYATNMTPQLNRLNQDMWANLEAKVRAQICNDTLYVVTGCYYANTNTTTTDRDGKVCPVPTNYFKVLLRTRTGTTGKRIADCSADELKASGSRGMMIDTMKTFGPDAFVSKLACVFQSACDTTFYIVALYFGSVGIKNTRYAIVCGLIADGIAIVAAIIIAKLFFL